MFQGTIHPFHKSHTTSIGHICEEIQILLTNRRVKLVTFSIIFNILVVLCLSSWYSSTQSLSKFHLLKCRTKLETGNNTTIYAIKPGFDYLILNTFKMNLLGNLKLNDAVIILKVGYTFPTI